MSQDSIILNKSLKFAARIVKLYQFLCKEKRPFGAQIRDNR